MTNVFSTIPRSTTSSIKVLFKGMSGIIYSVLVAILIESTAPCESRRTNH